MNFKEEYRSTFSQIHASEALQQKMMEATEMEGKTMSLTKRKKIIISILIAAALVVGSAVAVSAGALNQTVEHIKLFINGEEVSASAYLSENGIELIVEKADEEACQFELRGLPEDLEGVEIEIQEDDEQSILVPITEGDDEKIG